MRISSLIVFFLFAFTQTSVGQYVLKGKVTDAKSETALAFVSILANDQQSGTYSDIDGSFELKSSKAITEVRFSFVGYRPLVVKIEPGQTSLEVSMQQQAVELAAAEVVAGENPAHRIVNLAIANKDKNNPEKGEPFVYESYNKFYITLDVDSAIRNNPDSIAKLDSSDQAVYRLLDTQHFFMSESVTERKFVPPGKTQETVLANRISGLQTPQFAFFSTALQSFSFYEESVELAGEAFLGPLARNSTRDYLFIIEDTTFQQEDTVFVMSYRPRLKKTFKGLKGLIYINSNGYAIQNVIAEPARENKGMWHIQVKQQYEFVDGKKWFPVQLNANMDMFFMSGNGYNGLGVSRTYLRNIRIGESIDKRDFNHVVIKMDKMANKKPDEYWNKYRQDSLSAIEMETYRVIDSIGKAENIDLKLKALGALMNGRIPVGPIDFELEHLFAFNDYEGLRLGLGAQTNWKFSEVVSFGGYGAYGFRDKEWKYGGNGKLTLSKMHDAFLRFSYKNDVEQSGRVKFLEEKKWISNTDYYLFYANRFDRVEEMKAEVEFRTLGYFTVNLFGSRQNRIFKWDYEWAIPANDFVTLQRNAVNVTEAGVNLRFAFKEKFMQTMSKRISLGTKYPILYVRYAQGFDNFLTGELSYSRLNAKISKSYNIRGLGRTTFQLEAGKTWGDVPLSFLYNAKGSYVDDRFTVATPYAFETMAPNEFQAREYATLNFRHDFLKPLFKWKRVTPTVSVVTNLGIGELEENDRHLRFTAKDFEKGYFESGLELNNLYNNGFSGFGIGAYYNYGPYSEADALENVAIKMSMSVNF